MTNSYKLSEYLVLRDVQVSDCSFFVTSSIKNHCYIAFNCFFGILCSLSGVKKRKKKSANTGRVDGQIGRYVRGVQVIDSKDLRRVQNKIASNSRESRS